MPINPFDKLLLHYMVAQLGFPKITNIKLNLFSPVATRSLFLWAAFHRYSLNSTKIKLNSLYLELDKYIFATLCNLQTKWLAGSS